MFSHIVIGSNDIGRAQTFYDGVLAVIGVGKGKRRQHAAGQQRVPYFHAAGFFGMTEPINGEPASVADGSAIGFACSSVEQVQAFYDTALALGTTPIEDAPVSARRRLAGCIWPMCAIWTGINCAPPTVCPPNKSVCLCLPPA